MAKRVKAVSILLIAFAFFHLIVAVAISGDDDKKVGELIQQLKVDDGFVRIGATEALVKIGEPAVQALIECLKDEDAGVRRSAAWALAKIGKPAVQPLIGCLKDNDKDVRVSAASALGEIGDAQAVQALIECLKDEDWRVRSRAAEALEKMGYKPETDIERAIYFVAKEAWNEAVKIGKPAVQPLIECLKNEVWYVRRSAALALGEIGDTQAVQPLIECLKDKDEGVRGSAAKALGKIGDAQAVQPLIECLKDKDEHAYVRSSAAEALAKIEYKPETDIERAIYLVAKQEWDKAVKIGKPAVQPLIESLKYGDAYVRVSAAEALGEIGDAQAVQPLIECLKNEDEYVRVSAASALGRIGDAQAVQPLIECLKDDSWGVRRSAAEALGKIGYKPETDIERAIYLVAKQEWDEAAKIGKPAVQPLIECLKNEYEYVRSSAASALGKIGDAQAIPALRDALPDWEANLNSIIVGSLTKLGWKPLSEADQVYVWISLKDASSLKKNWTKTKRVLMNDLKSDSERRIKNAVYTFISLGNEKVIDELIQILDTRGNVIMAEMYLNCGHKRLYDAARSWAEKHGYSVLSISIYGAPEALWGSWR